MTRSISKATTVYWSKDRHKYELIASTDKVKLNNTWKQIIAMLDAAADEHGRARIAGVGKRTENGAFVYYVRETTVKAPSPLRNEAKL